MKKCDRSSGGPGGHRPDPVQRPGPAVRGNGNVNTPFGQFNMNEMMASGGDPFAAEAMREQRMMMLQQQQMMKMQQQYMQQMAKQKKAQDEYLKKHPEAAKADVAGRPARPAKTKKKTADRHDRRRQGRPSRPRRGDAGPRPRLAPASAPRRPRRPSDRRPASQVEA